MWRKTLEHKHMGQPDPEEERCQNGRRTFTSSRRWTNLYDCPASCCWSWLQLIIIWHNMSIDRGQIKDAYHHLVLGRNTCSPQFSLLHMSWDQERIWSQKLRQSGAGLICARERTERAQTFVFPHVSIYSLVSFHVGKEKDGTFMHQTCKCIKVSPQRLLPTSGFPASLSRSTKDTSVFAVELTLAAESSAGFVAPSSVRSGAVGTETGSRGERAFPGWPREAVFTWGFGRLAPEQGKKIRTCMVRIKGTLTDP